LSGGSARAGDYTAPIGHPVGSTGLVVGVDEPLAATASVDRPWGPAAEQRFPVIDAERGLVFGVTLLHYLRNPTPSQMYVSEVFKVIGGKIVRVDNIELMMQGVTTLGFIH
jgi:hypothetical protein